MKKLLLVLAVLFISGCAYIGPSRITNADKQGDLHAGMDFSEVVKIAGRGVSGVEDTYTEEHINGHVYATWVVSGKYRNSTKNSPPVRIYEFKFKDNKLVSWSWWK